LKTRRSIPAICLTLALPMAHAADEAANDESGMRKIPAISVLPDGSELEGVVLPRYDQNLRLTGSLHAGRLTLVSPEVIRGENVRISLIDPDREQGNIRIDLGNAVLDQASGIIRASEDVTMVSARFTATGTALHLEFEAGRGFVSGPATTLIHPLPETAMHTTPAFFTGHPRFAMAALGIAVATTAIDARPLPVSEAELAELQAAAASQSADIGARADQSRAAVANARETSLEISEAVRAFLVNQVLEPGVPPPAPAAQADAAPLDDEAGPEDTLIFCDDGFYFDAEAGILVYLGNVRVADPRFTLDGVDELKIIFSKKPEKTEEAKPGQPDGEKPADDKPADDKPADDKPADDKPAAKGPAGGFAAGLGDVERVIATGRVRFNQRQPAPGEAPVEASGALFNYNVATREIILSGGYPWVRKGNYYARALQPNLNLRISEDGSFVTEGQWEMKGQLDNLNRR